METSLRHSIRSATKGAGSQPDERLTFHLEQTTLSYTANGKRQAGTSQSPSAEQFRVYSAGRMWSSTEMTTPKWWTTMGSQQNNHLCNCGVHVCDAYKSGPARRDMEACKGHVDLPKALGRCGLVIVPSRERDRMDESVSLPCSTLAVDE